MTDAAWPQGNEATRPSWYDDCFRNALRRVAATLNARDPYVRCRAFKRSRSDTDLASVFLEKEWDKQLVQFHINAQDPFTVGDAQFQAEYFFYCDVDFLGRKQDRLAKFIVPETFLNWGYSQLRRPPGDDLALGLEEFGGDANAPDFVRHCATNYLVKNFWHNFVHRAHQGITTANYHQFGGEAREDSDFEADHFANLLLLKAYDLPVISSGKIGADNASRISALFQRNRCNMIFAERARHREEDRGRMSTEERWAEHEWRFRRAVSNQVSMELLTRGLASASVRVMLTGETRRKDNARGINLWRTGNVIIDIGGRRINTQLPPYLPVDELRAEVSGEAVPTRRLADMRRLRRRREGEIVTAAVTQYAALVRDDDNLRAAAAQALTALWTRLGVQD